MRPGSDPAHLPIVLASASPRRAELLRMAGIAFEQCPANLDESRRHGEQAEPYVVRLAKAKARSAWRPGTRSLGADTVVVLDGEVLGKPIGPGHARQMLRKLSGRAHRVLTGVALFDGIVCDTHCAETHVGFRRLTRREIDDYVASGEPLDKAGSYAIQGRGREFVERLDGSYTNVVGLPLGAVASMLR